MTSGEALMTGQVLGSLWRAQAQDGALYSSVCPLMDGPDYTNTVVMEYDGREYHVTVTEHEVKF